MTTKKLLAYAVGAATLAACGGESDTNAPDLNINVTLPAPIVVVGEEPEETNIVNTPLPIVESFDAGETVNFFGAAYKELATENDQAEEDNFYFSAAGLYEPDGSLSDSPNTWITMDSDPKIRFGNSRWTIGQTVSELALFTEGDGSERNKSTPGRGADDLDNLMSWGELDLSTPYSISFCVVDHNGGGNFQIYVDNNTSSSGSSIHSSQSRIYNVGTGTLAKGERVTIDSEVGTENSFIQMRVDSSGWIVIDDLVIENAENPAEDQPSCATKTTEFGETQTGEVIAEPVTGTPFAGISADAGFGVDFTVGKDEFFGINDAETFLSISSNVNDPFYKVTSGTDRISIADGKLSMANARFTVGDTGVATDADVAPEGDLDLTAPYRITIVISDFTDADPADDPGKFQVYVDNNTTSSSKSTHGGSSKVAEIAVGDGTITTLPHTLVLEPTVGTADSFIQLRADSRVGNITIDSITFEYTGDAPVNENELLNEAFDAADTTGFLSAEYKSLPTDPTKPMYEATSGESRIVVGGGELAMTNARFTVGSADNAVNTSGDQLVPQGTLDLSQPYTITFTVKAFEDDTDTTNSAGKFQVYVDNNTTGSSNSVHGGDSKLLEVAVGDGTVTTLPHTFVINSELGTETSFLQFRADSRVGNLVIDDLTIEHQ